MAVNTLLSIGSNALTAHQVAINVTGNNIANVDTIGYSRQAARYEAYQPLNHKPGQIGMGSIVAEVTRYFDQFAEKAYLNRYTQYQRWDTQQSSMLPVESLFNESNRVGVNSYINILFQDWQDLADRPNDTATREALLADASNLAGLFRDAQSSMQSIQREMDWCIQQSVDEVNSILEQLVEINKQIMYNQSPYNNPNSSYDKRDQLIRQLAEHLDIEVQERKEGFLTVQTSAGLPLLEGDQMYTLEVRGGRVERTLKEYSSYTGTVKYLGTDGFEYTLEMVRGGDVNDVPPPAFRVSIDGGRSWLKNDDGTELQVELEGPVDPANPAGDTRTIKVMDLEISFTSGENFCVGDRFDIIPKTGLYWVKPTREALNITPQMLADGSDNPQRVNGGALTAYFTVRDYNIGRYMDKMDALAEALIWETNYLHSQGAGNTMLAGTMGSYAVKDYTAALGLSSTGLDYYHKLTAGNVNFSMYDDTGKFISTQALDFGSGSNFDPTVHSLEDVVNAINSLTFTRTDDPGPPPVVVTASLHATILDGKIVLDGDNSATFAISGDTAGLMAGLGVNNFFTGSNASNIGIKSDILHDSNLIAHGAVNANGEVAEGDNATALAIAQLSTRAVKISTVWEHSTQSLLSYHATTVSVVGADMRTAIKNTNYNKTLSDELDERVSSISGVNLDEEMTNLIKFQHSYTAAAKLISTADQMLQTLLSLKQ